MLRSILIAIIVTVAPAVAAAQTAVSLRGSAALAAYAQTVRLADIADITGPDADRIGSVVVLDRPAAAAGRDGLVRLDTAAVRAALEATRGVNMGRLTLRGSACQVRIGDQPAPEKKPPAREARAGRPVAIDMTGPATIRTAVAARVALAYGVSVDRLRLAFDAADEPVLATALDERTANIDLGASPGSARLPINVTLYRGESIELGRTIQADVLVRRTVVKAATALERGRTIAPEDLISEDRWDPPTAAAPPAVQDLVGQVTARRVAAGDVLDRDDFAPPQACKRGDTVYVHCVSGNLVVKVKARALGAARDGEMVQLRMDGAARDTQPFTARMSGKGRAVMVVQKAAGEQER